MVNENMQKIKFYVKEESIFAEIRKDAMYFSDFISELDRFLKNSAEGACFLSDLRKTAETHFWVNNRFNEIDGTFILESLTGSIDLRVPSVDLINGYHIQYNHSNICRIFPIKIPKKND